MMELLRHNSLAWLERTNPLRGLSISRAGSVYDAARVQGSPRLQYMYNEIEATDPVLMTCVERRQSALAGLKRTFVARPAADPTLADEQRDALERFADGIDNFDAAIETMDEAFFRGYCHLQPLWDGDAVPHILPLKSWNFLRADDGTWLWNPLCHETTAGLEDVRGARLVTLERRRSIDWPALFIYIRKALGERDYGRFIERHGIPHAAIFMAPGTEEKDVGKYVAAANAWSNGQDVSLPNGASINLATDARGTDPFTPFVEHQDKYIVLLATGGTLTSLAQADTGSLAGGAQMEVWREIVARDGILIADAFNRCLFRRYLERAFPGRPMASEFRLENDKTPTPTEVADLAGKLKAAGYVIDQEQLESAVGFKLEREQVGGGRLEVGQWKMPVLNKEKVKGKGERSTVECSNYSVNLNPKPQPDAILAAFAADNGPAAEAVKELLKDLEEAKARGEGEQRIVDAFLEKLPGLMPEDPAMAAVIAEEMAKSFTAEYGAARPPSAPQENKDDANGVSHSDADGKFDGGNGGVSAGKIEEKESASDDVKAFLKDVPKKIKPEQADKLLTEGFTDYDGAGNNVHYGQLLLDHINQDSRDPNDRDARKRSLGVAMQMIRETSPVRSSRAGGKERVYFGIVDGKAYIAVADEHSEINALEMVSYRRDGRSDER